MNNEIFTDIDVLKWPFIYKNLEGTWNKQTENKQTDLKYVCLDKLINLYYNFFVAHMENIHIGARCTGSEVHKHFCFTKIFCFWRNDLENILQDAKQFSGCSL